MGVRLAFPPFTFDREERVLRRDGRSVPLAPKVAEALGLLLAEPGALVEKNALRDALWPDGFVEDGNLTQTIYLIRRALDPEGDGRTFVETIPRRGYRFLAPVTEVRPAEQSFAARAAFGLRAAAAALAIVVLSGGVSIGSSSSSTRAELTGEAARAYAVGRYNWNRRNEPAVRSAIANFTTVIGLAPNDARGYAGLADAYVTVGDWEYGRIAKRDVAFRMADMYAHEALRRDPRSGEALTTLGWIALDRDHDLDGTERMLHAALALRPDHAPAYEFLGLARLYRGDAEGGRLALRRSTELDPLSPIDLIWYARALYYSHRFGEARNAFRQVLELDGGFKDARFSLAIVEGELGHYDAAKRELSSYRFPAEKRGHAAMIEAIIDVRSGHKPKTLPDLRPRAGAHAGAGHLDAATASALCLALGRRDDALEWLRLAVKDPAERMSRKIFGIDPLLAPLHDDARFRALIS